MENISIDYKLYDDHTITELALRPRTLRPENIPLLIEEIVARKLDSELVDWIKSETNTYYGVEKLELIESIQNLYCTKCNSKSFLKGYKFMRIISFVIGHSDFEYDLIICLNCANRVRNRNFILTIFFGWWSIMGFLKTPFALINILLTIINPNKNSDKILNSFIDNNTGKLRMHKTEIEHLLKEFNDENEGAYIEFQE